MPPPEALGGQHGLSFVVVRGLGGRVRGGGGGACGHRADQYATSSRAGQLFAVLPSPGHQLRVGPGSVRITPTGVDAALGRAGAGQVHDDEVVGVVQIVEFGRAQDLRFFVEGGVCAEVQVVQLAELIERNDVGDFIATGD
jgi:hypothetical protein